MGPIDPHHSANGIRTRVWALRGPRPSPLDDSAATSRLCPSDPRSFKRFFEHRPGGNRTPNRRFWRPVLYQLSYGPIPVVAAFTASCTSSLLATWCSVIPNCEQLGVTWRAEVLEKGWLTGIEPATPGATDRCSNQLSYSHHTNRLHLNRVLQTNQLTWRGPCIRRYSDSRAPFRPC